MHNNGYKTDFQEGTLKKPGKPVELDKIASKLVATHEGIVLYEYIDNKGEIQSLKGTALYMVELKYHLFSPQNWMTEHANLKGQTNIFLFTYSNITFTNNNGSIMTIPYHPVTHLLITTAYKHTKKVVEGFALKGCIREEGNQNLSFWGKGY